MSKNLVLIPARGGSVGVHRKNLREFAGKPLLVWTVELAKKLKFATHIVVSTNDDEIAEVGRNSGASVPFVRPEDISTSETAIEPVVSHCVSWFREQQSIEVDTVTLLFPTNPMREVEQVEACFSKFMDKNNDFDCVFTVNEVPAHYSPFWTLTVDENEIVTAFDGSALSDAPRRRQDFPRIAYAKNDLAFVFDPKNVIQSPSSIFGQKSGCVIVDGKYDADINDWNDWSNTLQKFKKKRRGITQW